MPPSASFPALTSHSSPEDLRHIQPFTGPVTATVSVPGSKSYTNRALIAAALANGHSTLHGALFSDDTHWMTQGLTLLGIPTEGDEETATFQIDGQGGAIPTTSQSIFVGNSGTTARFLLPLATLGTGPYEIDGTAPMRKRPMGPLFSALRSLGARITPSAHPNCLPASIFSLPAAPPATFPQKKQQAGEAVRLHISAKSSSQFLTAILLAAPVLANRLGTCEIRIETDRDPVSKPYLSLTLEVLRAFGIDVENSDFYAFSVPGGQKYQPTTYEVEADASAASYFFAAAAITQSTVTVKGLGSTSLQGDLQFVRILEKMGANVKMTPTTTTVIGPEELCGIDIDMSDISDTAQTLAAIAPFATTPTRLTGIGFIRGKETDRVAATVTELQRLGIDAREESDGMLILPGTPQAGEVHTYEDHRMAMSFSLLGLRCPGIAIKNPSCVSKTFPAFFQTLDGIRPR